MTGQARSANWHGIGCSVRGASHRRSDAPNQDAIAWVPPSRALSPLILAIADGHGARASFRSSIGSALAVQVATRLLAEFLDPPAGQEPEQLMAEAIRRIPRELPARWRQSVEDHAAAHPLQPGESAAAAGPLLWYGSTILAAAVTDDFLLLLQLGDGDILIVSEDGDVRRPWPPDQRLLGGETHSLCGPDASGHVRIDVRPLAPDSHPLVLLCTDGYANSFRDDAGFLRTGRDILEIIRQDGIGRVESELETWLEEASELGSGDDITAGILWRAPAEGGGDGS
jgi:serine/threonine protein phosphatase PrpC